MQAGPWVQFRLLGTAPLQALPLGPHPLKGISEEFLRNAHREMK